MIFGIGDLSALGTFADNGSVGAFIQAIVNFLIVAWVMFLVVKAYNRMKSLRKWLWPKTPSCCARSATACGPDKKQGRQVGPTAPSSR